MRDMLWHCFVGNDVPPWVVATCRGVASALVVGALGFLAAWQQTDEVKALVSAGLTPALTILAMRLGIEGFLDTWKSGKPPRPRR